MKLSFVIPLKNEQDSLCELVQQISESVEKLPIDYELEIILIDDGSNDNSWEIINNILKYYKKTVKGIRLRRNFGKSTALEVGFRAISGDIIFTMDADLQDDPTEIHRFLRKIEEGFDLVSGWKKRRYDPFSKTFPSKIFNWVTARVSGVQLHDFNCGFKCYKREVIEQINIRGELHRYIPVLAHDIGYKIGEIEVEHHPRLHGVSKYSWERYARGFIDLLTVMATTRWLNKPGHLFGGVGLFFGLIGGGGLFYLISLWFLGLGPIGNRPLLILSVMMCLASLQMISLGIIAEFFINSRKLETKRSLILEITEIDQPYTDTKLH